jgi:hypothetical protein
LRGVVLLLVIHLYRTKKQNRRDGRWPGSCLLRAGRHGKFSNLLQTADSQRIGSSVIPVQDEGSMLQGKHASARHHHACSGGAACAVCCFIETGLLLLAACCLPRPRSPACPLPSSPQKAYTMAQEAFDAAAAEVKTWAPATTPSNEDKLKVRPH